MNAFMLPWNVGSRSRSRRSSTSSELPLRVGFCWTRTSGNRTPGEARHVHVVELEPLGRVDGHHLHRVVLARLHGRPLAVVLDRVHVVEERAQRELALDGLERVHLLEERREVAPARGGHLDVDRGVELGEQAGPADDLGEELPTGRRAAGTQLGELGAEFIEPLAPGVREPLHVVEVLERLGHEERVVLEQVLVLAELELVERLDEAAVLRRDHAATRARSRSPIRKRGPVRIRASATPSAGSSARARTRAARRPRAGGSAR